MKFLNLIFFFLLLLLMPFSLHAASLSLTAPRNNFSSQEEFLLSVDLNTEGTSINALEGELTYPANLLELKEIRDGDSVVTFWIERLSLDKNTLTFSGIIPGGYSLPSGHVVSLVFQAKVKGEGEIELKNGVTVENNKETTQSALKTQSFAFTISTTTKSKAVASIIDADPPEKFEVSILKDENVFEGKAFLIFASQDKGSGLSHYEVKEGLFSTYKITNSPHLLQNQNLDKKIFVKAIDKSGNERISTVYPDNYVPWHKKKDVLLIFLLLLAALSFLGNKKLLTTPR
jgi:hypothetical protein